MKPTSEELATINSRLPGTTLSADAVEIFPFRVFDNQVTDRFTIMTPEMMKKLVKDLNAGNAAFNKLHESRYALPVGRSVSAKIVQDGNNMELQAKMYAALQNPDGTPFIEGKDLADRYNIGAVFACSAGVSVGFYKCSICGNDIRDYRNCDHFPGSTYKVDEVPTVCYAYMTGKDIQDGMAMDCSIYEVSAVTAGGVRRASVLSETFGLYDKDGGTDLSAFKKEHFEDKNIEERFMLYPLPIKASEKQTYQQGDFQMADLKIEEVIAKNYELIADKAKAETALATLQGEFSTLNAKYDQAELAHAKTKEELATVTAEFTTVKAQNEEFTAQVSALTAEKEQFTAQVAALTDEKATLETFKAAYIAVVAADGVRIGREADYASKTLDELSALHAEYKTEIAKLPSGQHTLTGEADEDAGVISGVFESIPATFFKTN